MGNFATDELIGVVIQSAVFLFGIVLVVGMELVELKKRKMRAKRLTDFTVTARLSQSKS